MKKCLVLLLFSLLLCGCAAEETFETVGDDPVQPVMARPREIFAELPGEAAMPAIESDSGRMYLCDDYEIYIQTMDGGNLDATVRSVSGYGKDDLTVMETQTEGAKRYEFVWASAGETGDRLGRGVILDDGNYHYVMTVLRDAESTEQSQVVWSDVFRSFALG